MLNSPLHSRSVWCEGDIWEGRDCVHWFHKVMWFRGARWLFYSIPIMWSPQGSYTTEGSPELKDCLPFTLLFCTIPSPSMLPVVWWERDNWHMSQICCLWTDGDFFPPGNIFKPRISMSTLLLRECVLLSLGLQLSEKKRRFIGRNMIVHMCTLSCKTGKRSYMKNYCMWLLVHGCTGSFTYVHTQSYSFQAKRLPGWEIM